MFLCKIVSEKWKKFIIWFAFAKSFSNLIISSYNTRKFLELPYQSFKIDKKEFETSPYLTNLTWLHNKINSTGCVQLLLDIYLISPPKSQQSEPQSPINSKLSEHLEFLMKFLQIHFKSLNYDAQQIYSLLSSYIKIETSKKNQIVSDLIVQRWNAEIEDQNILRIEKIDTEDADNADEVQENDESNENGYDSLINTNHDENFVISLSTDREEICVWNLLKWVH